MKQLRNVLVLALVMGLVLSVGMFSAAGAEDLTTVTVLGYNQGSARMGYFPDSAAYAWLMEKTQALGVDLKLDYVESDQYSTTITTRLATGVDLADMMFLEIDAVTLCDDCKKEYDTIAHGKICPYCGSDNTYLLRGNEFEIKEIAVTESPA